jgi:hypothetical protein
MRVAPKVELNPEQAVVLEQRSRGRSIPARVVERSRIILLAAGGKQDKEIASELQISVQKSARWRARFLACGIVGLEKDATRPGRTPSLLVQGKRLGAIGPFKDFIRQGDTTDQTQRSRQFVLPGIAARIALCDPPNDIPNTRGSDRRSLGIGPRDSR